MPKKPCWPGYAGYTWCEWCMTNLCVLNFVGRDVNSTPLYVTRAENTRERPQEFS
jgi:hypothetical protein